MKYLLTISMILISNSAHAWLGGEISNGASNTLICSKEFGGKIHSCSGADVQTYSSGGKPYCSCKNNAFTGPGTLSNGPRKLQAVKASTLIGL